MAVETDESKLSEEPCPFCFYRPTSFRDAGQHLLAHAFGTPTTGNEQIEQVKGDG